MSHEYQAAIDAARQKVEECADRHAHDGQRCTLFDAALDTYRDLVAAVSRVEAVQALTTYCGADDSQSWAVRVLEREGGELACPVHRSLADAEADADQKARAVLAGRE